MLSREDQWTQMYLAYTDGPYDREFVAKELAAACLLFRDAPWAVGLYPSCSHGQLGVLPCFEYGDARRHRAVWLAADDQHRPVATYQETFGSPHGRVEHPPDLEEATLRKVADWLRGSVSEDAG